MKTCVGHFLRWWKDAEVWSRVPEVQGALGLSSGDMLSCSSPNYESSPVSLSRVDAAANALPDWLPVLGNAARDRRVRAVIGRLVSRRLHR